MSEGVLSPTGLSRAGGHSEPTIGGEEGQILPGAPDVFLQQDEKKLHYLTNFSLYVIIVSLIIRQ